ncbi:MAG: tyrosine-type recombinase/integrase, partial [Oscillospiraceae bacterium]|nr:tyrosine-type recombinase/integrase [Oscillospiraceae bacterium]
PRTMQYRFAKLLQNADLPSVHFHSLRHAFASGCIALGFDVKTLSEILGHSYVELTLNRYVHTSMERKRVSAWLCSTRLRNRQAFVNVRQRIFE